MRIDVKDQTTSDPKIQKVKTSGQEVQNLTKVKNPIKGEKLAAVEEKHVSNEEVFRSIERANEKVMVKNTELRFSVHDKTNEIIVKVMNTATQEVIREIPSEQVLDMIASFMEIAGLYVDEKA